MNKHLLSLFALGVLGPAVAAEAKPLKIRVSWANYQEERTKLKKARCATRWPRMERN